MAFNFPQNIQYCADFVQELSALLKYSHISSAYAAILIGTFILFKSKYSLLGKILFSISLDFSFWVIANLIIWIYFFQNNLVMATWAPIEIFSLLLFILCLYFTYVFIENRDVSTLMKVIALAPLIVVIVFSVTEYNLTGYDIQECIAIENTGYVNYTLILKVIYSLWLIIYSVIGYFKADNVFRKQVLLLTTGIAIFLLSFLSTGYLAVETGLFVYEAIGLFGMVVFVGILGYLIVKFKTFNIKVIAAQALVATMVFLIGASLFYVNGTTDLILSISTLMFICLTGYFLTRSVRREVEQREKIEKLAVDLEKANDNLKELDRQKDELMSIVSHQLAAPITSIKWYLELFKEGDLGALQKEQQESVVTMQHIAVGLADLVGMILDVSRIQLGRVRIEPTPLDLGECCREILATVEPKAQEKKQNFEKNIAASLPVVMLDKRYTRMTIENLLTNAIKYTPEGGTVRFSVEQKGDKLLCSVQDTGCGIPKAEQSKIFGKLFRASNVRNTAEGNGFGLYVAKGAVEAQGGRIWFESEEGKGTTFFVEVPMKEAPPAIVSA